MIIINFFSRSVTENSRKSKGMNGIQRKTWRERSPWQDSCGQNPLPKPNP